MFMTNENTEVKEMFDCEDILWNITSPFHQLHYFNLNFLFLWHASLTE